MNPTLFRWHADLTKGGFDTRRESSARALKTGVKGRVCLVGAGCGDPELLTLKAVRMISEADVIVYDRLVSKDVLNLTDSNCRRIYVGKKPGEHAATQEEIIALLHREAVAGRTVVRLKGGDPYVFGRGSEELQALVSKGVHVEVCPGITAALGCAASSGIPLTHRGMSTGCLLLTGRDRHGKLPIESLTIDLREITVAIYMGVSELSATVRALKNKGLPDTWPMALIENGTTRSQRSLVSTLSRVEAEAAARDIRAPALLMIGQTVSLAAPVSQSMACAETGLL